MNLLSETGDSTFVIRKWNIVNDQSTANYDAANENMYNTEVLNSNICNYNDSYILVRGDISIIEYNRHKVTCQSCAPFTKSIT